MNGVCEVNVVPKSTPGRFTGLTCGEAATVRVESGCVHEHVFAEDVCPVHAQMLLAPENGMACTKCWADGHDCAVAGRLAVTA